MYVREYTSDARAREKPCLRCGLSLRKHLDDRHCPQCGLSVWMSLNPNEALDYSNAAFLRKTARGTWLMAGVQVIAFVAFVLFFAASFIELRDEFAAVRQSMTTTQTAVEPDEDPTFAADETEALAQRQPPKTATVLGYGAAGVYFVLEAIGLVMMAVHEQRYPDRAKTTRRSARIGAGFSLLVGVGLLGLFAQQWVQPRAMNGIVSWGLMFLIEVTFVICAFCSWFWLRPIARRAGRSSLARLCGYLMFLPVVPFLKAAPFFGLYIFYLASPLLYLLPFIYIPLSIYLFARCAWLIQQAIPHAESAWAAETAVPVSATTVRV